jgi:hypothetical protein
MRNPHPIRPLSILARSIYREFTHAHYSASDVVRFVNELLDIVTHDMQQQAREDGKPVLDGGERE